MVDENNHLRIIDFGLSFFSRSHSDMTTTKGIGSRRYLAPEQLAKVKLTGRHKGDIDLKTRKTTASDVWAYACILFEVCDHQLLVSSQMITIQALPWYVDVQWIWSIPSSLSGKRRRGLG
jgi:serine/threonine protein kinase